ncbi:hypothetical protein [Neisseria sp. Ec49-e6-T10]|uniref:hypothetical protein n=1 Tax=Neisseria sp. Ec49-e6-T10 TaxID=3140744 RepID=UPI003EBAE8EB
MGQISGINSNAITIKRKLDLDFHRRGIITAVLSGVFYGTYTASMTLAMSLGIWQTWYGENSGLSTFAVIFLLSALGAATTDTCSAVWAIGIAAFKGKLLDFFRCLKSKPGAIMIGAALVGGPLASTFYVIGLQQAGSIVVPISALCPAIGAILGRFLFKQTLNSRMLLGIGICFLASVMIGMTGFSDGAPENLFLGIFFGFLAALGWGIEGCVAGYSTSMIDPEIGITIRQVTSGLSNLIILVPIFSYFSGVNGFDMVAQAFTDVNAMMWFVIAGLGAYLGFMLWYKGNAMCGAALGMSCNGAFSFWGPFFCWLLLGIAFKQDGWSMPPIAWLAAVTMIIGIFTIAMNPLDLFKKREQKGDIV